MKTFFNVIFAICLVIPLMAQDALKEGVIKYEITDASSDDNQMNSQLSMMVGSTMDLYFKDGMQRTDMSMMGGMMKTTSIANTEEKTFTNYMNMAGQKVKVVMSEEEMEQQRMNTEDPKIEYDKDDTKSIAGYNCYKATWTVDANGQEMNYSFYITDEISVPGSTLSDINTNALKGVPLSMTVSMESPQDMNLTYTAQEVNKELPEDAFAFDESGYEEMSMKEMQEKFQTGGMPGM